MTFLKNVVFLMGHSLRSIEIFLCAACLASQISPPVFADDSVPLSVWLSRAREPLSREETQSTIQYLDQALHTNPRDFRIHMALADMYYRLDEFPLAIRHWEKAQAILSTPGELSNEKGKEEISYASHLREVEQKLEKAEREILVEGDFQDEFRKHFKIRFEGDERYDLVWAVSHTLLDAYRQIGRRLDVYPEHPVTVVIYSREQFARATVLPDWVVGAYDGKIRLRAGEIEPFQSRSSGADDRMYDLERVVYHEVAHAFIYLAFPKNIPVWLHEGLAQWLEPDGDTRLDDADGHAQIRLPDGKEISILKLDGFVRSSNPVEAGYGYLVAKRFVMYLENRYNVAKIKEFVRALQSDPDVSGVMEKVFARPVEKIESAFWNEMI